jgi:nucleoside-diphosphate-sugar epimerase
VFITGVGGFIGLRLAERCVDAGVHVAGIDHDPAAVARARERGVDARLGGLDDGAALRAQMAGFECVVHTAAIVKEGGALDLFREVNVEGSRRTAQAARDAGVRTFVHLSSVMVYGFRFGPGVTEAGPLRGEGNAYCTTKIESEGAVLALNGPELGVIIIRPGDVYGPGSVPWVARPVDMLRRRRMVLPDGGRGVINHVYVDNLIDGILAAVEARAYGEAFNITDGVATSSAEYFGRLAVLAEASPPLTVPAGVMRAGTYIVAALHKRGLTREDASPDTVSYLLRGHAYSIAKARRRLGYEPQVGLDEGLRRTAPFVKALIRGHDRA